VSFPADKDRRSLFADGMHALRVHRSGRPAHVSAIAMMFTCITVKNVAQQRPSFVSHVSGLIQRNSLCASQMYFCHVRHLLCLSKTSQQDHPIFCSQVVCNLTTATPFLR